MTAARPFAGAEAMAVTGDVIWAALSPADWLEAFAAHPRIGERVEADQTAAKWSVEEQAGVADAARARWAAINREYEQRFGHIFIVCATGRSGPEMLDILQRRMRNSADVELREAAEQQRQITRLRLARLIDGRR